MPGTARELLPLIQPATKALAQVLAGNTKASGQFVHARNMVERADQMIEEKQIDRLTIRDREAFLEQLALLKLTLSDAEEEFGPLDAESDDEGDEAVEVEASETEAPEPVDEEAERVAAEAERERVEAEAREHRERLKRVALALMSPPKETPMPEAPDMAGFDPFEDEAAPAPRTRRAEAPPSRSARGGSTSTRRPRITLRSGPREDEPATPRNEESDQGVASEN